MRARRLAALWCIALLPAALEGFERRCVGIGRKRSSAQAAGAVARVCSAGASCPYTQRILAGASAAGAAAASNSATPAAVAACRNNSPLRAAASSVVLQGAVECAGVAAERLRVAVVVAIFSLNQAVASCLPSSPRASCARRCASGVRLCCASRVLPQRASASRRRYCGKARRGRHCRSLAARR